MVNWVLVRKLLRDLLGHKASLLALVAVAAIGVGSYVGMTAVYHDMDGSRHRYYVGYRLADFTVDMKRAPEWAVEGVASMPNVRAVRGRVCMSVRVDLPNRQEPIGGTAISMPETNVPVINDCLLRSGQWFSGRDDKEVVLNDAFARANGLCPGSRIRVVLLDSQHDLLVVGTAMSPEFVYLIPAGGGVVPDPARFAVMYLTKDFLQKSCDLEGAYNQLVGLAHDNSRTALDNTLHAIEDKLDPYGVTSSMSVYEQPSAAFLRQELAGLKVSATVTPTIFLGVGALVLNILIGRIVAQQRTVIGTLRALGYSTGAILRHYLGFGLVVGAVGGVCGLGFGLWVQWAMGALYRQFYALPDIAMHFYPNILLIGFAIGLVFALVGTVKGVRHAVRLQPAEAMRPPQPERGGRVLPERIGFLWRRLTFGWKMVLRAIFRNPFRSGVCIAASFISTTLVFGEWSLLSSIDYMMFYQFDKISHQDMTVMLRDPVGRPATSELAGLPGVREVEPQLAVVCDFSNGPYKKRTDLTGIAPGNRLYTPLDRAGKPVVIPDEGLVLTRKLAEILDVRIGDALRLRPLIGRRQEAKAVVVGTVDSFLGLSAYADASYLSRLLGEDWAANCLLANVTEGAPKKPLLDALKERPKVIGIGERARSLRQMVETLGKTNQTIVWILVLLAGTIAFASVLNAALVSLSERQREVGTLRVLGFMPGQVARIFAGESYLLNGTGVLLGLVGGVGYVHLLARLYDTELFRFPVAIYPSQFFMTVGLMIVFIGSAQAIVSVLIRRLPWLDVLKVKE